MNYFEQQLQNPLYNPQLWAGQTPQAMFGPPWAHATGLGQAAYGQQFGYGAYGQPGWGGGWGQQRQLSQHDVAEVARQLIGVIPQAISGLQAYGQQRVN